MSVPILSITRATRPAAWLAARMGAALCLAALADFLFYGHAVGWSLGLFVLVLSGASALLNPIRADGRRRIVAIGILITGVLAVFEDASLLSIAFALLAAALYALALGSREWGYWLEELKQAAATIVAGPKGLTGDCRRTARLARRLGAPAHEAFVAPLQKLWREAAGADKGKLTEWIVPAVFFCLFL